MFDKNNDGFIDKNELKDVLKKILPKFKLPDSEIQRMISNVDRNQDGKIDYNGRSRIEEISPIVELRNVFRLEFVESIYPQLPK